MAAQRRLLRETRAARAYVLAAGLLGLATAVLVLAQAVLLASAITRSARHGASVTALAPQLVALGAVLLARALVQGAFELSGRRGAIRVMSELRGRLASALLGERAERPAGLRTGELAAAAVQGVDALESWFAGYLPQLVLAAVVPVAVLGWVAASDPIVGAILAGTVPILVLFMALIGRGAQDQTRRRWRALSLLSAHFLDVVRGLPTLIAFRRERAQADTLAQVGERYRAETVATLRIAFLSALVLELCAMIGTALAAATIGVQLIAGALGLQAGLTVLLLAPELYGPLRGVGQQFHAGAEGLAGAERIFAVLDRPVAPAGRSRTRRERAATPDPARAAIRLEGVTYEYPGRAGAAALDGLELELAPGAMTALVGASGAGKSTLVRLLLALADPSAGRVSCGGVDLRELDRARWRERIAWAPQRAQLFAGTVAENVRLGAPAASEEQLERALELAGASGLVEALPQGLRTRVGEGAERRLSAGQTRRIALARTFARVLRHDSGLLVLDEPTAHLDEHSAHALSAAIGRLARGRTALLIVHHPALAAGADRMVRLAHGRVVREQPSPSPSPGARPGGSEPAPLPAGIRAARTAQTAQAARAVPA